MRAIFRSSFTVLALVSAIALGGGVAEAKCKRMGFLVNDYGKDGPANDAKNLLEKEVAKWAAENGIKNYTIGKKDVSCELFIDLILFDEHTCTASANVCWDEPGSSSGKTASSEKKKSSEKSSGTSKKAAAPKPAADKKAEEATEQAKTLKTAPSAAEAAPIETGTLPGAPEDAAATQPKPAEQSDAAERAAAAAERAAEAAERAAAAAEKAAKAAAATPAEIAPPSQLEMPSFGAGASDPAPAAVDPVQRTEPKS